MDDKERRLLPNLRQDLKLFETSAGEDGAKRWLLFDPIQNKYFTIALDTFQLISHWQNNKTADELISDLQEKGFELDEASLSVFVQFIVNSGLTVTNNHQGVARLIENERRQHRNPLQWLLHNYLFIRVPVVKPDRWLTQTLPKLNFLYSKSWQSFIFIIGIIGIFLALRNWDVYITTFQSFFSKEGLFFYIVSLIFIKSCHELGHAFTAKRYGCKVPSMGIAFLVLFPVLYTDTTDSWKLRSREQRLKIVLAGVKVELYIAMIATFLWSFTPNGILNSILFMLATTSWITSVLLNISPFMRFDGYYVLSDWSNSENLQPRSFAMAKWYIRKKVLGLVEEAPEYLHRNRRNFFIIYAILTAIYRFFLFLGIALLVYYFAFKVLGIILFVVEIVWFILLPIYKELKIWWSQRDKVSFNKNNLTSMFVILAIVVALFIPWNNKVYLPAILQVKNYVNMYPSQDAQISSINVENGEQVRKGDVIISLTSPELLLSIEQTKQQVSMLKQEMQKSAASKEVLSQSYLLAESLVRKEKELEGLVALYDNLTITAPFDGYVSFNDGYKVNQWVNTNQPILSIYNADDLKVRAFCPENRIQDIDVDSDSYFVSNLAEVDTIKTNIYSLSQVSTPYLPYLELSSEYGGDIAARNDSQKRMHSEDAYYQINANLLDNERVFKMRTKGTLVVSGVKRSIAEIFFVKTISVLIRESGF